ncbi:acyl-CoA-binding domain-containing protein 7 isoform X2 [Mirounga angustirostris]|uniref:acyl-CoA-binding domain-containing protein 7 isoform X2 n=1 Tax=Mirounga angustirostris TaxID=9716 RepID=UPI00313C92F1
METGRTNSAANGSRRAEARLDLRRPAARALGTGASGVRQWLSAVTMSSLQADFDRIAEDVRKLKTRPDDEELKELYGLYKQSVVGDINIVLPEDFRESAMMKSTSKCKKRETSATTGLLLQWRAWKLSELFPRGLHLYRVERQIQQNMLNRKKEQPQMAYQSRKLKRAVVPAPVSTCLRLAVGQAIF